MLHKQFKGEIKGRAKYLLAIVLAICSMWLVWEHCLKFLSGSTTIVREQKHKDYLPLPHFLLCNKQRYNKDEIASMDLPDDFFDNRMPDRARFSNQDTFPISMPLGRGGPGP